MMNNPFHLDRTVQGMRNGARLSRLVSGVTDYGILRYVRDPDIHRNPDACDSRVVRSVCLCSIDFRPLWVDFWFAGRASESAPRG